MRHTLNISLPEKLKKEIERTVEEGMYSSKSEFMRELLRLWKNKQLVDHIKDIEDSRTEAKNGKLISQDKLFKKLGI